MLHQRERDREQHRAAAAAYLDAYDYVDDELSFTSEAAAAAQREQSQREQPQQPRRPKPVAANAVSSYDCRAKTLTLPHEKYCDLYYHTTGCDDGQKLLRSCPNGLLYKDGGRSGLIGVCDYPHNIDCRGGERHSECKNLFCSARPEGD